MILIVDDDPDIVQLLTQALAPDRYRIVTANDGEAALRLARSERPALILIDWQMPAGPDGTEVTRALRDDADPALRDTPVVLITGRAGAEDTAAGFAAGVTDYLTKPFRAAHVRTRVQTWLMRRPT
jgi:two-component system phosphate regulon response regulator PhoB